MFVLDESAAGGFYNGNDIDSPAQGKNKGVSRVFTTLTTFMRYFKMFVVLL